MTTSRNIPDYVAWLERDLLELPQKPYSRCCVCGEVGYTDMMREKNCMGGQFYCCCGQCEERADLEFERFYSEFVFAY